MIIDVIKRHADIAQLLQHYGYQVRSFEFFPRGYEPSDLVLCGYWLGDGDCSSFDVEKLHKQYPDLLILIVTGMVEQAKKDPYLKQFPILDQLSDLDALRHVLRLMLDSPQNTGTVCVPRG